jgi:hypothetical protein
VRFLQQRRITVVFSLDAPSGAAKDLAHGTTRVQGMRMFTLDLP